MTFQSQLSAEACSVAVKALSACFGLCQQSVKLLQLRSFPKRKLHNSDDDLDIEEVNIVTAVTVRL